MAVLDALLHNTANILHYLRKYYRPPSFPRALCYDYYFITTTITIPYTALSGLPQHYSVAMVTTASSHVAMEMGLSGLKCNTFLANDRS